MKNSVIISFFLLLLLAGCKEKEAQAVTPEAPEKEEIIEDLQEEPAWKQDIQLNNGQQWQANTETTEGILKMTELIEKSKPSNPEDFRRLGNELNEEKNLVIKRCTMKGPSHDNLHIFLQPLIGKIGELQVVETTEKGQQLLTEIMKHLEAYHSYFI